MKVLLISPVRGLDPPCGDITYTEELISNMGQGIEYVTYDQAIADGSLVELTRRNWRVAPLLLALNKFVNKLRQWRWLYWEPIRFFMVKPGIYDLVHVHLFPFKMLSHSSPILYSAGAPIRDLYRHTRKYSHTRENVMRMIEIGLSRFFGNNHSLYNHPQIDQMVVYTDHFETRLEIESLEQPSRISVLPISLATRPLNRRSNDCLVYGFIAFDFHAKGGEELIRAFRKVLVKDPSAKLFVVGMAPSDYCNEPNMTFLGTKDRKYIVEEFLPAVDVFVFPTHQDCFSYVMLEALRAGCAICTSDYVSMPEAVDYGNAGLISPVGDSDVLAENMIQMLDPSIRSKFQTAARRQFDKKFDSAVVLSNLYDLYSTLVCHSEVMKSGNEKVDK
jgi:glycosyltransferase involved in cell wall biosynthesis